MGFWSKPERDVAEMRKHFDDLVGEVNEIETKLNDATQRREALEAELDDANGDLAARWRIEEQIGETKAEISELLEAKARPSTRLAQLRAVLQPVLSHERDVERRTVELLQLERLLEAHALLLRVGTTIDEARQLGRQDGTKPAFPNEMRKLEAVVRHWDTHLAPMIRRQLAEDRRIVAIAEDAR